MKIPFEAVVLRYVPDEGAAELLNVGVVMRTQTGEFFRARLTDTWTRISDAFPDVHVPTVRAAFRGVKDALDRWHQSQMDLPGSTSLESELRRLLPSPDGPIKWSPPIAGVTDDAEQTFDRLLQRYVEQHVPKKVERESRTDEEVGAAFRRALEERGTLGLKMLPRKLVSKKRKHFELEVQHSWKNGRWNCVHPLSLDLLDEQAITNKGAQLLGTLQVVAPSEQDAQLVLFVGLPPASRPTALEAAREALAAIEDVARLEAKVYREDQAQALLDEVEADLRH